MSATTVTFSPELILFGRAVNEDGARMLNVISEKEIDKQLKKFGRSALRSKTNFTCLFWYQNL